MAQEKKATEPANQDKIGKVTTSKQTNNVEEPDTEASDTQKNHIDYVLTFIGYTVGFGNIWRYPYLAFENVRSKLIRLP